MTTDFRCSCCGGTLTLLGRLGTLLWFRCRDCGADQNVDVHEADWTDDEDEVEGRYDEHLAQSA